MPKFHTLSELYCYSGRNFTINCDNTHFSVVRERDKTIIEHIPIGDDPDLTFFTLKDKYIFDYENVL